MMQRIVIGYPCQDLVVYKFCRSLSGLLLHQSPNYTVVGVADEKGIYVDENRNNLVKSFLSTDADWLLQLDTDLSFPPTLLDTLLENTFTEAKVISGWYFLWQMKNGVWGKNISAFTFNGTGFVTLQKLPLGFVEVDGVGAGCLFVHRSIYELLGSECFSPIGKFKEDLSFCLRLRDIGISVLVDSRARLTHHKMVEL